MDRRIFLGSMASTLKEILPRLSHAAPFGGLKI
jgi:hypothetical protein